MKRFIIILLLLLLSTYAFSSDEYFEPLFLEYWRAKLEEIDLIREEPSDANVYYFYGKYFRGRTIVQYANKFELLNDEDKKLLEAWGERIKWPGITKLYKYRVKVIENGQIFWIYMSDSTFKFVDNDELLLISYYNIGGINSTPVFQILKVEDQLSENERNTL